MLGSFLNGKGRPKPRQFNITTRHYNADKEAFENRVSAALRERDAELNESKQPESETREAFENRIRAQLRMGETFYNKVNERDSFARLQHQKNKSNVRFLIILNVLIILTAYLFLTASTDVSGWFDSMLGKQK